MMVSRDQQASRRAIRHGVLTPGALPLGVSFSRAQNLMGAGGKTNLRISFPVQFLRGQEEENGGVLTSVPVANMSFP